MGYIECLQLFQDDPEVDRIILIGEIGGREELDAAEFIKTSITKPVFAYIAGHHAPAGIQLGHAGAILGSEQESATNKSLVLQQQGVIVAKQLTDLIENVSTASK
jgi:succinyl-CoA synthetase alpha subunit